VYIFIIIIIIIIIYKHLAISIQQFMFMQYPKIPMKLSVHKQLVTNLFSNSLLSPPTGVTMYNHYLNRQVTFKM